MLANQRPRSTEASRPQWFESRVSIPPSSIPDPREFPSSTQVSRLGPGHITRQYEYVLERSGVESFLTPYIVRYFPFFRSRCTSSSCLTQYPAGPEL